MSWLARVMTLCVLSCGLKHKTTQANIPDPDPPPTPPPGLECWSDPIATDYRGYVAVTQTGITCQKWTDQIPHQHDRIPSLRRGRGLGNHNYCRNPTNSPDGTWCYTTNPNIEWQYCDIGYISLKCEANCWCDIVQDTDYRGYVSETKIGDTCQKWTSQSPQTHSVTADNYPNKGLGDHNYCRNPNGQPDGAWCYTTNLYKRWGYCDIGNPTIKCVMECWCDSPQATDYRGYVSETKIGDTCQKWTSQSPHTHTRTTDNYRNKGLGDHNYCRNPDGEPDGAWCYTTNPVRRWQYCDIRTVNANCAAKRECWEDSYGRDYRGHVFYTKYNERCINWTFTTPRNTYSLDIVKYQERGIGDHSYCRNPNNDEEGPWCYCADLTKLIEYCDIGSPSTNCD